MEYKLTKILNFQFKVKKIYLNIIFVGKQDVVALLSLANLLGI